jgi:hypothetical protein
MAGEIRHLIREFTESGLTTPEDIVPFVRFLVSEGWWITGQWILANGGYSRK